MASPRNIIEKIWDLHAVAEMGAGRTLLALDRVFLHERTGPAVLAGLADAGRSPLQPQRVLALTDHIVSTLPGRTEASHGASARSFLTGIRQRAAAAGIELIDLASPRQGIVHVVAPEQGLALPGMTIVCPDSHTGTVGGLGALAWGIGSTEGEHAVATMTLVRPRPRCMRVRFEGALPRGSTAKDMVLALIARHGASGGQGMAVEFAGSAVRALDIEARLTLCNMAVEFGAWTGLVAPDERTIDWLRGRPAAPAGAMFEQAAAHWRGLASDERADFDAEIVLDVGTLAPQVTWGTSPAQGGAIDAGTPPGHAPQAARALDYMGLQAGQPLLGLPIDAAFIGSCTNARLSDLCAAAALLRGRRVAAGVRALVVPGSMAVRAAAEAEGLDRVFIDAGFEWRLSGCSLCFFSGGDDFGAARRVVSSTNRNFEGRQGPGVRTHLASPLTVAASAIAGCIADPRPLLREG